MPFVNKKAVYGWSLYDWANSAFATSVMAVFFPIFFKKFWCVDSDVTFSTALLGISNSISGIIVALSAPVLGAIADRGTAKKRFLIFFTFMGVVMTSGLYMVSRGEWQTAVVLYIAATVGFSGANTFYDALITSVSRKEEMDSVSSLGFSLGYLGGGLLLSVNVLMSLNPHWFGLPDPESAIKITFLIVGIWWMIFSLPLVIFVKEDVPKDGKGKKDIIREGFSQLISTFRKIRSHKNIFLFLLAYWLYIDGVDTIIRMAMDYGISIGFNYNDLVIALLITQFVGFPATLGYGYIGERIGTKRAIYFAIAVYLFVSIWGAFMDNKMEFYAMAVIIGLVQGGIQALSRSFYARIIPIDNSGEYFGFYNMIGKSAVIIGPAVMGGIALIIKMMGYSSNIASRGSIVSISILLLSGGIFFYFVEE